MALYEDELATRSNETGRSLRAQPPADMTALRDRLSTAAPSAQPSAVPPRNVPLGTPGGSTSAPPGTLYAGQGSDSVVRPAMNPNTGGGRMSPEAEAFLKSRAATPGSAVPSAAPAVAPAAAEAAPAAARTISKVARGAGPAGLALSGLMEGRDVARVAQDPNKSGIDVATQASEGAARIAGATGGAALGAQGGAALGALTGPAAPVAVPVLGTVGAIAGGVVGYEGMKQGIAKLRSMFGLDPNPPAASAVPQYQRDRQAKQTQPIPANAPATQPQRPANAPATPVATPSPRTISGVAESVQSDPKYTLGENATEIYRGGDHTVATFKGADGQGGAEGEVPFEMYQQGRVGEYRKSIADTAMRAMTDPGNTLAKQRLENEGRVSQQEVANRGHIEGIKEQNRVPKPEVVKDLTGNVTGVVTYDPQPGGGFVPRSTPMTMRQRPALAKAHADAKSAISAGADPSAVNKQLEAWGYPTMNFSNK